MLNHKVALLVSSLFICAVLSTSYQNEEIIVVFASKVGPYSNPSEAYAYYDKFPFCSPTELVKKKVGLGEAIEGDKKVSTTYEIPFLSPVLRKVACEHDFTANEILNLEFLVKRMYYFQYDIDGITTQNFFGVYDKNSLKSYIFTHIIFNFEYNPIDDKSGHVIHVNITSDPSSFYAIDPTKPGKIQFTYSSKWEKVDVPYQLRNQYAISRQAKTESLGIHWLSIINSLVLVLLLIGFISIIIIRTLRKDYAIFEDDENDYGWKVIGRDIFRPPAYWTFFSALLGVGIQFITITAFILILAIVGIFYPGNDGSLFVSVIVLYAITSAVGGYFSNTLHINWGGNNWVRVTLLTLSIFGVPFFTVAFIANMVAAYYGASNALPFLTILKILAIWILVGFPLTLIGGIIGKRTSIEVTPPIKPKTLERQMPDLPIFASLPFKMIVGGFLPFSSIYIELYYLFDAIWAFADYQLWGILIIVFFILIIVTCCISISLTYFQLSNEDYRWWWHSYLNGASTGIYIYLYAMFYFAFKSEMQGFLQVIFYFGYSFIICYFFSIMLGAVSFFASLMFINRIYSAIPSN